MIKAEQDEHSFHRQDVFFYGSHTSAVDDAHVLDCYLRQFVDLKKECKNQIF
jgi:hypothetical protein